MYIKGWPKRTLKSGLHHCGLVPVLPNPFFVVVVVTSEHHFAARKRMFASEILQNSELASANGSKFRKYYSPNPCANNISLPTLPRPALAQKSEFSGTSLPQACPGAWGWGAVGEGDRCCAQAHCACGRAARSPAVNCGGAPPLLAKAELRWVEKRKTSAFLIWRSTYGFPEGLGGENRAF